MNHALNTVFKTENGWRDGVHPEGDHVRTEVIIITDGESNDPDNTFTIEGQKLKYDEAGIKVYALGVGDIKKNELETLTSRLVIIITLHFSFYYYVTLKFYYYVILQFLILHNASVFIIT